MVFSRLRLPKKTFSETRYLVIDLEMTGLNPEADSIVSAGCVQIHQGRVQLGSAEHHYFLPSSLMADDVGDSAHIHLITDTQRETQGESLADWLRRLSHELLADAWVFHHATIDMKFLTTYARRLDVSLPKVPVYDTLVLERDKHKEDPLDSQVQLSLNACRARYGLPLYRQHHALSDALATAELFCAQQLS